MAKGRHKVADLKLKPESYTKPSTPSLAPPLRQVKGREKSKNELVTKPASTTATKPNWRAKMLDARAARKTNIKLCRLRTQKEKKNIQDIAIRAGASQFGRKFFKRPKANTNNNNNMVCTSIAEDALLEEGRAGAQQSHRRLDQQHHK